MSGYMFYPGCSLEARPAISSFRRRRSPKPWGWSCRNSGLICCGSTPAHQSDPLLALALSAQNLAAAEGRTVAVCCAACYSRLKVANHEIASDPAVRQQVAKAIGRDYDGKTPVLHLLEILGARCRREGDRLPRETSPAGAEGRLLLRLSACRGRPEVTNFDDAENPTLMDQVVRAAGAEALDWPHKTECCGASYSITDVSIVLSLTRNLLAMAKAAGADCIATACPLCQLNLDLRQKDIEQKYARELWPARFLLHSVARVGLGDFRRRAGSAEPRRGSGAAAGGTRPDAVTKR